MSGFDINQLAISGNLTGDPELHHLGDGTALCKMRIANNDRTTNVAGDWINRPSSQRHDLGRRRRMGSLHLAKGDKVVLAGRLKWSEWDASDGKRQAIEIQADSVVPITLRDAWETHEDSLTSRRRAVVRAGLSERADG